MPVLIEPDIKYRESYAGLISEFGDEELIPFTLRYPYEDFEGLIRKLRDNSAGKKFPDNFVPNSTYWLLDDHDEIVAVSNLRHYLTEALKKIGGHIGFGVRPGAREKGYGNLILKLTLAEAFKRGIQKALLTCNKSNRASAKIIINNGGVLDSEEFMEEQNDVVQRYWITISTN